MAPLFAVAMSLGCGSQPGSAPAVVQTTAPVALSPPAAPASSVAAPAPASVAPAAPLMIEVIADVKRDGKARHFNPGDALKSYERFAVTVFSEQPVHVYLVACSAAKTLAVAYAPVNASDTARQRTRLPLDDDWFELDNKKGTETLYVVASRTDLGAADPALAAVLGNLKGSASTPCEPEAVRGVSAGPQQGAGAVVAAGHAQDTLLGSRGFTVVKGDGEKSTCRSSDNDLIVCRFWFVHQ